MAPSRHPFCEPCSEHLTLLTKPHKHKAAAFAPIGPPLQLAYAIKRRPYLAKGAGAYLVARLHNLNWPLPETIAYEKGAKPLAKALRRLLPRGQKGCILLIDLFDEGFPFRYKLQKECPDKLYCLSLIG